jgi:yecA family protein
VKIAEVTPVKPQPLTDAEFEHLSGILRRFDSKRPMNSERLDGFFAALICGPQIVPPSEYLPKILGDDMVLEDTRAARITGFSVSDHASLERHRRYLAFG